MSQPFWASRSCVLLMSIPVSRIFNIQKSFHFIGYYVQEYLVMSYMKIESKKIVDICITDLFCCTVEMNTL